MALHVGSPPTELTDGVREVLRRKAEKKLFRTRALEKTSPDELSLGAPHGIYTLGAADLAARRGLDAAEFAGWRYLVQREAGAIAAVEIPADVDGNIERFMQLNEGQFVGATFEGVAAAEKLDEVRRSGYELRLLKIPALYTVALWLHPEEGGEALLIPIGQCHAALVSGQVYSPDEFVGVLAEPAEEVIRLDTSPKGKGE